MPRILEAEPLAQHHIPLFADFECGQEPWETECAEWIRTESLDSIRSGKSEVFVYRDPDGAIVGYGSLGFSNWKVPPPDGARTRVSVIPYMALCTRFHGQPTDEPADQRYCRQILRDLIARALEQGTELLGLFVHEQNVKAIALYRQFGFQDFALRHEEHYLRMARVQRAT